MNKRLFGSLFIAGVFAMLLFGSALFFGGSTQAQVQAPGQAPGVANVAANAPAAAQGSDKAAVQHDNPLGVWATVAPFPTISISPTPGTYPLRLKRAGAAAYPPNGKIYVFGGRHGIDGEDTTLRNIYEYTPGSPGTWLLKSAQLDGSAVGSRWTANMAVVTLTDTNGMNIYAIGGTSIDSVPTNTVRIYNPIADTLTTLTSDPWPAAPARNPGGWAVYNNKLYIFGGFSSIGTGAVFPETWRFDPLAASGSRWTQLTSANLPTAKGYTAGAVLDGFIYAIGGDTWNTGTRTLVPITDVVRMDPSQANPTWTTLASLPTARGDLGAWAYDTGTPYEIAGRIAVAGGVYPTPDTLGYLYDPGANTWGAFPSLVLSTRNYGYAQLNGYLYAFGGYDYSAGLPNGANYNQRYDATTPIGTSTPTSTGTLPTATRTSTTAPATSTSTATATVCSTNYSIATGTATIVPGITNIGSSCDDCVTGVTIPFSYTLYDQAFTTVSLDSNGRALFPSGSSNFTNTCLPSTGETYVIFPYWDDLRTDGGTSCAGGCGIFTSTSGSAPNRIFNMEWRTTYFSGAGTANFEVRLYEGQARFDVIYGAVAQGNTSATGGVQKNNTLFTQYFCEGAGGAVTTNLLVTYTRQSCTTGTPVTSTVTASATTASTNTATRSTTPVQTVPATPVATATCSPSGGTQDVGIANFAFDPSSLTVPAGTTIRWTNNGGTHTSTSDTTLWDSGTLQVGGQFTFTFTTPGTYSYHCSVHSFMTGTITVQAAVPCSTNTVIVPTSTNTAVPPTSTGTSTAIAPTGTNTTVPSTSTRTSVPASSTPTSVSPSSTSTTGVASATRTTQPATAVPTSTVCAITFTDVQPTDEFYPFIRCLACRGIVTGYSDGKFLPFNMITRGQIAKMVSNSAQYNDPIPTGTQTFTDVLASNPFYLWIERVHIHGTITGYPCGSIDPCDGQGRPYFHPFSNATRGQLSKIVAIAAGISDPVPANQQTYTDVLPGSTFWLYIEQLTGRSVMSGYICGGVNPQTGQPEPCDAQNRAYFRPDNDVTRGQSAKIVANTFFPNCQTPSR